MKLKKSISSIAVASLMMLASFGAQASAEITITSDVFENTLTVEAQFEKSANAPISIQIVYSDTEISKLPAMENPLSEMVYYNQDDADSNGKIKFVFPIDAKSGKYIVRLGSMADEAETIQRLFEYKSYDEGKKIWDNLTQEPEKYLEQFIEFFAIKDEIILSMKADADLTACISDYDNIGDFTKENVTKLTDRIKLDCETLVKLKESLKIISTLENTSQLKPIVTDYETAKVLGIEEYVERYTKLKNTRLVEKAIVGKTFETKSDFVKAFVKALNDAEDAQNNDSKQSSGDTASVGKNPVGSSVPNQPFVTPVQTNVPFDDIEGIIWAKDAIVELYNMGIINGKSSRTFAPNDYILREEFVKMTVLLLGLEPENAKTSFADVDDGAWYAPYIAAAVNAGFINGYSDTEFGVGNYITRQDVAVILSRISKFDGEGVSVSFSDEAQISDYAKDAVKKLSTFGIINGSNGAFMPKNNCTRAETACMIQRTINKMKEGA